MPAMKKSASALAQWKRQYARLRRTLARTGYISQGSVMRRTVSESGRSGCQWTRKVAGKTVTVALSPPQFDAMKQAVANERSLQRTVKQMEQLSRHIIFATTADTRRRKHLNRKVLGFI